MRSTAAATTTDRPKPKISVAMNTRMPVVRTGGATVGEPDASRRICALDDTRLSRCSSASRSVSLMPTALTEANAFCSLSAEACTVIVDPEAVMVNGGGLFLPRPAEGGRTSPASFAAVAVGSENGFLELLELELPLDAGGFTCCTTLAEYTAGIWRYAYQEIPTDTSTSGIRMYHRFAAIPKALNTPTRPPTFGSTTNA
ncbi:hypothetical protein [Pseudonocardia spinosispora]|uniref:hypothetical protein n=1 Tax=Pseudonocardia spinosispora TaxID=103441 RepID=UPI00048EB9BF|nr:hypothetical protein [Pseudonocardia spinosispora]